MSLSSWPGGVEGLVGGLLGQPCQHPRPAAAASCSSYPGPPHPASHHNQAITQPAGNEFAHQTGQQPPRSPAGIAKETEHLICAFAIERQPTVKPAQVESARLGQAPRNCG